MTRIAFFAHDSGDAAVRRRVQGFRDDGLEVIGFMARRRDEIATDWDNVDLGRTYDANYLQRIGSIFSGAKKAAQKHSLLASADVIYARNLDMLATAFLAKRKARLKTPVIYESLDVHRLLTRSDWVGGVFRKIEGALLARTRRLVVSSPAFLSNHFQPRYKGRYQASLIENRLAAGANYGPRPAAETSFTKSPLRIGWVGVLRCSRSLDLLLGLARRFDGRVQIKLHGQPALTEIPDFHARVASQANVRFHGPYRAPEDLAKIYAGIDVVWAGDFMEKGANSLWLLPNRLYEGGYYGVPPIAPTGTETARWIEQRNVGFTAAEDLGKTLAALVEKLVDNRTLVANRRSRLLELPESLFVQPRGTLRAVIDEALVEPRPRKRGHGASTVNKSDGKRFTTQAVNDRVGDTQLRVIQPVKKSETAS